MSTDDRYTPDPADRWTREVHAIAFNALTRALGKADRFVALSEREACTTAVLSALAAEGRLPSRVEWDRLIGVRTSDGRIYAPQDVEFIYPDITEEVPVICQPCRVERHTDCPGGTWCDCQHRTDRQPAPTTTNGDDE